MALHETIQDFPAGIPITDVEISTTHAVGKISSPFSFKSETHVFPGQRWELSMQFLPMDRATAGVLESWIKSLRGMAGRFRIGDPYQSLPQGQDLGFPLVLTATAGSETVQTKGWYVSIPGQLYPNDMIQIGDELYSILHTVDSDAQGEATLTIFPALRKSYQEGTEVKTRNARGVFTLTSNRHSYSRNVLELYGMTLDATEYISP